MKKLIIFVISMIMILNLMSCANKENNQTESSFKNSSQKDNEEIYLKATELLEKEDYLKAVELFEEIITYKDSQDLLSKASYIYGSKLFNDKDFENSYLYLTKATGYPDIKSRIDMVNYFGGVYYTNEGQHIKALKFFKRAVDSDYITEAIKHLSAIQDEALSGGWRGNCIYEGKTLQVEMSYSRSNKNFSLIWADRSNGGYKHVTNMDYGTLSILGTKSTFCYKDDFFTVEFDFISTNKVRLKWSDITLNNIAGVIFERKYTPKLTYKISGVDYPTMNISTSSFITSSDGKEFNELNSLNSTTNTQNNTLNNKTPEEHICDYTIKATCEEPAKCICGKTIGDVAGHDWQSETCTMPKMCLKCGITEGTKKEHNFSYFSATCWSCGEINKEHSINNPPDKSSISIETISSEDVIIKNAYISDDFEYDNYKYSYFAKINITVELLEPTAPNFYFDIYDTSNNVIEKYLYFYNCPKGELEVEHNIPVTSDTRKIVVKMG